MSVAVAVERRAILARLSLCVAVFAVALLVLDSEARAATPIAPKLLSTNPVSTESAPATSITPVVFGEAEPDGGANTSVVRRLFGSSSAAMVTAAHPTQHPEYEIVIHEGVGCIGATIGRGASESLEVSGIAVTVRADAKTILSAEQIDPADPGFPSACSGSLFYWEGNVPLEGGTGGTGGSAGGSGNDTSQRNGDSASAAPGVGPGVTTGKPAPPRLHLSPKAVANFNTPAVAGTAPGAGSVLVYSNGDCSGTPVSKGSAPQLSSGFQQQVADNTTTTFSAIAVGGKRSDCSAPVTYTEDSTAPVTKVTMGPGVKTRKRKVVFRFADVMSDPPGTSFRCKVGKARWKPCASPLRLKHLRLSRYVVRFRATDLAGNAERVGAKRIFTVVPVS